MSLSTQRAARSAGPWVTAVVVTRGRSPYLPRCLVALAEQTRHPDAVVLVDAGVKADPAVREMALRCGVPAKVLTVAHTNRARSLGQAVAAALLDRQPRGLLWLLHDDVYPEPEALDYLMQAMERAPSVAVVGPKQVKAADPTHLVEVGVTATPFGRTVAAGGYGELDQGQHDRQEDVLGVGTAGMLISHEVFEQLGGFDPALGPYRDGLELCRRAHLAGHRVVVAPDAVVLHEQASYLGLRGRPTGLAADRTRSFAARRRALIYTQLVEQPLWLLPLVVVAGVASALGRAVWRLASKEFGLAVAELMAPVQVLARPARVGRARRVAARASQVDRNALRRLQITPSQARRQRRDQRTSRADERRQRLAPTDIEQAELRLLAHRRRRMSLALGSFMLLLTGATVGRWLGPGNLTGGAAGQQPRPAGELMSMAGDGWLPVGLGWPGPGDPLAYLVALFRLPWGDSGFAIKLLFVLTPVLAGFGAWWAAGAFSRSNPVRAWFTLFYFASPALWQSLAAGRLGASLTHAALPWVVLGAARAVGANRLDRRPPVVVEGDDAGPDQTGQGTASLWAPGSVAAAAGAGLAFAVAAAGTPGLLAPGVVLALIGTIMAPAKRRLRVLAMPIPALVLFGPHLMGWAKHGHWRALLVDPGPALAYDPAPAYLAGLGYPTEPTLPWFIPAGVTWLVAVGLVGLVVLAALSGLWRRGAAGVAGRFGWLMAGLGLALVLAGHRFSASMEGLTSVVVWTGAYGSVVLLGLLIAAAAGLTRPLGPAGEPAVAWRRAAAGLVTAALLVGPLAATALNLWQWLGGHEVAARRSSVTQLPRIAQAEAAGKYATRTLVISQTEDGYGWSIIRGEASDLTDPLGQIAARQLTGWPGQIKASDPATAELNQLVGRILGRNPGAAARDLALSGIGFVLVTKAQVAPEVLAALDATPGLGRITDTEVLVLWRVSPDPLPIEGLPVDKVAPLFLVGETRAVGLAAGRELTVRIGAELVALAQNQQQPAEMRLVLAERQDPGWRATLNGRPLEAAADEAWQQSFVLPLDATGRVRVWYQSPVPWVPLQLTVLGLTALLALPLRRSSEEEVDE